MELELNHHILVTDEQSQQMAPPPPTYIFDGLRVFPGTSPFSTPEKFVENFEDGVMANPTIPHILGGVGEPLSAKLSVALEMFDIMTHPGGRLRRFARENGFRIRKYLLTWGEPFGVIEHRDLPAEMSWKEKSRIQTPEAVPIFFDSLARTIKGYDRPSVRNRTIRLVAYDAVAHTGYKFAGDPHEYGLIRANQEMQQLATHTGPFEGLAYTDWRFGIAASNELRMENMQFRAAVLGARSEKELRAILVIWKKTLLLGEEKPLASYGSDEASIENTREIEEEMDELAYGLALHGHIDLSAFGGINSSYDFQGPLKRERDVIMGGIVNPKMFELTQANPLTSVHFFNQQKSAKGAVLNLKGYRSPVRELYYAE